MKAGGESSGLAHDLHVRNASRKDSVSIARSQDMAETIARRGRRMKHASADNHFAVWIKLSNSYNSNTHALNTTIVRANTWDQR